MQAKLTEGDHFVLLTSWCMEYDEEAPVQPVEKGGEIVLTGTYYLSVPRKEVSQQARGSRVKGQL